MIATYPKGGKKPGKRVKPKSERIGDPYRHRAVLGRSEDEQFRARAGDYGKNAPDDERESGGMMVSPRKTMIGI